MDISIFVLVVQLVIQLFTACAVVVAAAAAIIGPFVAYWAAMHSLRSGARIDWNLELRNSVTSYLSAVWQTSSAGTVGSFLERPLGELIEQLYFEKAKITLLLNPDESLHQELVDAVDSVEDVSKEIRKAREKGGATKDEIMKRADATYDDVMRLTNKITRTEWKKV